MKVAFDLDGTLDTSESTRKLMRKLHEHGHKISILTGCPHTPVTKADKVEKKIKIAGLGLGDSYDKLKVFSNPPSLAKLAWCKKHNVGLLIDNCMATAQLAPDSTTVLVPWKTLTP